jgi:uncharacterized membrane protein
MTLDPLLHASPVIQIHALVAILALVIGAVQLFRRKGDAPHRTLGIIWVALMAIVALSSFFIWTIRVWGLFSPIHLISIFTLWMLWRGVQFARTHDIRSHMRIMQATYLLALIVTGLFTMLPGRIMNKVVFGRDAREARRASRCALGRNCGELGRAALAADCAGQGIRCDALSCAGCRVAPARHACSY